MRTNQCNKLKLLSLRGGDGCGYREVYGGGFPRVTVTAASSHGWEGSEYCGYHNLLSSLTEASASPEGVGPAC